MGVPIESVVARVRHPTTLVTAENVAEVARTMPDVLARIVEPGCVAWTVPGKRGHVVVACPHKEMAGLGYEWDECIMLGSLRMGDDGVFLVEARSGQELDLNHPKL